MPIINRAGVFPPGGWAFYEPLLNWRAPAGLTFNECVEAIIKIRTANPRFQLSVNRDVVADTLETFTCHRINFDPHYCTPEVDAQKKTTSPANVNLSLPAKGLSLGAVGLVASVKSLAAGAQILTEWLGAGGRPVKQELAEQRAATCIPCPFNVPGNWKTKVSKEVAGAILEHLRAKNELALKVTNESKLGTCNACLCHLPLKVQVPLEHIVAHTSPEVMASFHPNCWIPAEVKKKAMTTDVTVVITNYQRPQFLKAAFASAHAVAKHIVITSSGATPEIESIHQQCKRTKPDTVIVSEKGDSGCNANWLAGIRAAPTNWITILHDDDLLLPEFKQVEGHITPDATFLLWDPRRHGMSYKDTCPILSIPTGIYPSTKLLRSLMAPGAMTFSPTIGCFRKSDLIEILEEARTHFKDDHHLTPTMMVGNDLLIWLRCIQKHRTFKYLKSTITSFGHHEGSTTCNDVFNRHGKLVPIYKRTREYFMQSHPKIVHTVSRYTPSDRETTRRIEEAVMSWKTLYLSGMVEPVHVWTAPRDSGQIGDHRRTHYLKDILKAGMDKARDQDYIMFTNDDTILHPDLTWFLLDFMQDEEACCAFRQHYPAGTFPELGKHIDFARHDPNADRGRDMFCFSKGWLQKHWDLIPDYLLGSTDFDSTLATLIRVTKGIAVTNSTWLAREPRCEIPSCFIFHEKHEANWATLDNRKKLGGNTYNRTLTKEFIAKHGVGWYIGLGNANTFSEIEPSPDKLIPIIAHLEVSSGYGALTVEMTSALLALGCNVELYQGSKWNDFKDIPSHVRSAIKPGINNHPWNLVLYPSVFQPDNFDTTKNKRTAWFSMWESTSLKTPVVKDFIHGVTVLNRCVVAIVPCSWNASVFSACGVNVPIKVCPLGVDTDIFYPCHNNLNGPLVFGSAARTGVGGIRKGLQSVVDAFRMAFRSEKDAILKIKCFAEDPPIETGSDSRIHMLRSNLTKEALVDWYKSINVFVSGSASEGWGRHQHEAMAVGRPVIGVDFGGVCEFFSWENGYVVEYDLHPAEGIYSGMGCYAKPILESMAAQMRRAYDDRKELKEKSKLSIKAAERFTLENSARTLVSILKEYDFL